MADKYDKDMKKIIEDEMNKSKSFLDKPRDSITDDRYPGKKLSIREIGTGIKEGYTNYKDMVKGTGIFEKNTKSGDK